MGAQVIVVIVLKDKVLLVLDTAEKAKEKYALVMDNVAQREVITNDRHGAAVLKALHKISGQDFNFPKEWQNWFEQNKDKILLSR